MEEKVIIFDTTLRDGEQVPGCQLNTVEKIEVAQALEALVLMSLKQVSPFQAPVISTPWWKYRKLLQTL